MFKVGDLVLSIKDGKETDQVGRVTRVSDTEVIVSPVEFPFVDFSYNLEGNHLINTEFSIKKLEAV